MLEFHVGSPVIASRRPFVYIGFSRTEHVAYVGMTIDKRGAMGRWTDHLSRTADKSSFRRRLHDHDELCFERLADFQVVAFDLGDRPEFLSKDTGFREAVEYRVQRGLLTLPRPQRLQPHLEFISHVRDTTVRGDLDFIVAAATEILMTFRTYYAGLNA